MLKMDFEWDPRKAAANLAKHGVDFEIAIEVFLDGAAVLEPGARRRCQTHHLGAQSDQA
jgi:uncharacterized DUF497 family protein